MNLQEFTTEFKQLVNNTNQYKSPIIHLIDKFYRDNICEMDNKKPLVDWLKQICNIQ